MNVCAITVGSYECLCHNGYLKVGEHCNDFDECNNTLSYCHEKATCGKLPGSFNCTCKDGYTGNGLECKDVETGMKPI